MFIIITTTDDTARGLQLMKLLGLLLGIYIIFFSVSEVFSFASEYQELIDLAYVFVSAIEGLLAALLMYGIQKDDRKLMVPSLAVQAIMIPLYPFFYEFRVYKLVTIIFNFCFLGFLYKKMQAHKRRDTGNVIV